MKEIFETDLRGSEGSTIKGITTLSKNRVHISQEEYRDDYELTLEYANGSLATHKFSETFKLVTEFNCFGPDIKIWTRVR